MSFGQKRASPACGKPAIPPPPSFMVGSYAHDSFTFSDAMRRMKSKRQVCTAALGRRSTRSGITIIAFQPSSVRFATAAHGGAKRADSVDCW